MCKHPNLVKLLGYYEESEKVYVVMEHIKGPSLHYLLTHCSAQLD